ncbi:MAG: hypothetical protein C4303_03945, partial [candidate division GAL15 bacterium]
MEAAILGIPTIAVSLDAEHDPHGEGAAAFAAALAQETDWDLWGWARRPAAGLPGRLQ